MKQTRFGNEVKESILRGARLLKDAVATTMGPGGRNVLIEDYVGDPHLTKDGVTVANHVESENHVENMAIKVIRQAARETAKKAGDGTTTSVVLAENILVNGIDYIINSNVKPTHLVRGINEMKEKVINELTLLKQDIDITGTTIENVALISCNGDETIAKISVDAKRSAGINGIVKVEEGTKHIDIVKTTSGLTYRHDPITRSIFSTPEMKNVYKDIPITTFDEEIKTKEDLKKLIDKCTEVKIGVRPIIFVRNTSDDVGVLVEQLNQSNIPVILVKADGFGERKRDTLFDIAAYTNATVNKFTTEKISFGKVDEAILTATEVILKRDEAPQSLHDHLETLEKMKASETDDFVVGKLEERIIKLSGNISTIYVGGRTETELKERKDRFDDTVAAIEAALDQGVLPGGGNALMIAYNRLLKREEWYNTHLALLYSITRPIIQIANNYDVVLSKEIAEMIEYDSHFDIETQKFTKDIIAKGVVDPYLVTVTALENAVSAACNLITTEVAITVAKEDQI